MRKRGSAFILLAAIFWQHCRSAQPTNADNQESDFQKVIQNSDKKQLREDRKKLSADKSKEGKTKEQIRRDKKRLKLDRKMKRLDEKKLQDE